MAEKAGLLSRLLENDSALGIIAGLTTLVVTDQQTDDDGDEEDAGRSGGLDQGSSSLGNCGEKRKTTKSSSRVGVGSVGSPNEGVGSQTILSASAKKYSVQEQRDVIRQIQERNQILKQELSIESRDAKQLLANEKRQRVEYLQQTIECFVKKIEATKKTISKLDESIAKKEYELEAMRQQQYHGASGEGSRQSTSEGSQSSTVGETGAAITRRVRSLENRQELSLVKRNEMDSINKHYRWQIEKVRKDRVIFDGIYKKLEKELSDFQSRYDASVGELKKATDAKEHVTQEIQQIKEQAEKEQHQYDLEFKELRHVIENAMYDVQEGNARLGDIGAIGLFGEREEPIKNQQHGIIGSMAPISTASPSPGDSPLKRITALSSWKIGFDKALATTSDCIVSKYDQIFDGIKKTTGINDITRIAEAIMLKDEENFKRFKHVEELHREEAALKTQVEQLSQAIEEFKAKEGIATGATQKQQYRTLETKYHQMLEKNRTYDVEYEETTNKLTRIKSSVHSIHSMLAHANCAKNADQFSVHGGPNLSLGSHSARDVTDTNILEYLQAIEIFTSSLMKENHDNAVADSFDGSVQGGSADVNASASSPIGQGPSTLPSDPAQQLRVQVPSFGGLNGVIILPASTSSTHQHETQGRHFSALNLQQHPQLQQRKKTNRFELSARKSLSQQQFAAALAGSPASSTLNPSSAASGSSAASIDDSNRPQTPLVATASSIMTSASSLPSTEDDDAERAYTYEELRAFAARHTTKKRDDAATRLAVRSSGGAASSTRSR